MIAAKCRIDRKGGVYLVPSQSGEGKYAVCPDPQHPHCTCPDHENGHKCKHIFAVEFVQQREENADGTTTTRETVVITEKRKTYRQNWPAYNAAQTCEKAKFQSLLRDLCERIPEPPPHKGAGRPRLSLCDSIFAAAFKVYSTVSGRRFMTDLNEAKAKGYVSQAPCYNSIFKCLESEEVTPILQQLITESSLPLKTVEVDFAVDSSGFTSSRFIRWFDHKYGTVRQEHQWVKAHLICGVKTNIVTGVEIRESNANDSPLLRPLVEKTAENFTMREVYADKGYPGLENYATIEKVGAIPFIPFKTNQTGNKAGGLWAKMFHYFAFRKDEFMQHYHKRSNVESTFSMIKGKFRDHVRSKTETAMRNEVLCKILCHNIVVLIHEMYELNIEPNFWAEDSLAHKIG